MKITNTHTKESREAEIIEVEESDYDFIEKSDQFEFNWKLESRHYEVYRLNLLDEPDDILGLISIMDLEEEFRIHINLIEVSKRNVGRGKLYDRIAGCLLVFACEQAFERSYGGFVSLLPKTALIEHYCQKYGFQQFGRQLAVDYDESLALIKKYH